jgi:hypothetical protein
MNPDLKATKPKTNWKNRLAIWVIFFMILFTFWLQFKLSQVGQGSTQSSAHSDADSLYLDSLARAQFLQDSLLLDSLLKQAQQLDSLYKDSLFRDSVLQDSLRKVDSLKNTAVQKPRPSAPRYGRIPGVNPLEVFALPSGGEFSDSAVVYFICDEPGCTVHYRTQAAQRFIAWNGQPVILYDTTTLVFYGLDTANLRSAYLTENYLVYASSKHTSPCPTDMAYIPMDSLAFCMDLYLWPNKANEFPQSFVSHDAAMDSCLIAGKRLCSLAEFTFACNPQGKDYPYGAHYSPHYCASQEASVQRSGTKSGCRSYHGVYDLSGNLWEWTATPHPHRSIHYWVAGGYYDGRDDTRCNTARFSFFPQNQYPSVGFRCCSSLE